MKIKINRLPAVFSLAIGCWLIYNSAHALYLGRNASGRTLSGFSIGLQIFCIVIFGVLSLVSILKISYVNGLVEFNEDGIDYHPDRFQKAKINWKDVLRIDYTEFRRRKVIVPILKFPEEIIASQTNWFSRFVMKNNLKTMGSPVAIRMENYSAKFAEVKNYLDSLNLKTVDTVTRS